MSETSTVGAVAAPAAAAETAMTEAVSDPTTQVPETQSHDSSEETHSPKLEQATAPAVDQPSPARKHLPPKPQPAPAKKPSTKNGNLFVIVAGVLGVAAVSIAGWFLGRRGNETHKSKHAQATKGVQRASKGVSGKKTPGGSSARARSSMAKSSSKRAVGMGTGTISAHFRGCGAITCHSSHEWCMQACKSHADYCGALLCRQQHLPQ